MINHVNSSSSKKKSIMDGEFTFAIGKGVEITFGANDLKSFQSSILNENINFKAWFELVHNAVIPYQSGSVKYGIEELINSYDEYLYYSDIIKKYSSIVEPDEYDIVIKTINSTFKGKYLSLIEKLKKDALVSNPPIFRNIDESKSSWIVSAEGIYQESENFKIFISNSQKEELFSYIAENVKSNFEKTEKEVNNYLSTLGKVYNLSFLENEGLQIVEAFSNKEPSADELKNLIAFFIEDADFFDFFGTENSPIGKNG